jgi:hypothetical protein
VPRASAQRAIASYAQRLGVRAEKALGALDHPRTAPGGAFFHAVALDADGAPVPIMNSDEGFVLLFTEPDPAALDRAVSALMRPFPAGLMTDAGMLVANPAYAPTDLQQKFTRDDYHGTVVWSWQQLLFAAGLERQLRRCDLPAALRKHLRAAQATLWEVIQATRPFANSELWSWQWTGEHFVIAPFGADSAHVDESNAAQLWSTADLSVRPPANLTADRPHSGGRDPSRCADATH